MPPGLIPATYPQNVPQAPAAPEAATDRRSTAALLTGVVGIGLGVVGLVAGGVVLALAGGDVTSTYAAGTPLWNAFGIGIFALALGPVGYFMGRSALARIAASNGQLGGRQNARAANFVGIAATIIGAGSTLGWLVIVLLGFFGPPPSQ